MPRTSDRANRRWKRLTPLLLIVVGFGAGVLVTYHGSSLKWFRGEHRGGQRDDADRRSGWRHFEGTERAGYRGRDARDGEERRRRFREQLVRRLDLDTVQRQQMDAFIEENRAEARVFWDDYQELRLRFRKQIREILNDSQRETFDAWGDARGRHDRDADSVEGAPERERR